MKLPRNPKRLRVHLFLLANGFSGLRGAAQRLRSPLPDCTPLGAMTPEEWQTAERSVREFLRPR